MSPGLLPMALSLGPEGLWWTNVVVLSLVYALLGVSLNVINGYGGMFSLGHHGFWALGAYAAAWLTREWHGQAPGPVLFAASAGLAMAVATVGGALIGVPCLRLRGDYLAIATLGFGEIVRTAIVNGPATLGGALGLKIPRVLMDVTPDTRATFRLLYVGVAAAILALVAWAVRNLVRSRPGRTMLAVAQDDVAAGLLGIDPTRPKVTAFLVGAALAGLAGAVYAHYQGTITPQEFGVMEMVKILLIVVLGGLGSLSGCVVAAFLLVVVEQALARTQGWVWEWWQVEYALILILLMVFRPRGIFGPREVTDVWRAWRGRRRAAGGEAA